MSIRTRLNLWLGIFFLIFWLAASLLVYNYFRAQVEQQSYETALQTASEMDSVQRYVVEVLRPMMFEMVNEDEFVPEAMSGVFVTRNVYERFLEQYPDFYIKFAANSPMNPVNLADGAEQKIINEFETNLALEEWRGTIERHGQPYFTVATPFRFDQEHCFKCHGDPANAPLAVRQRYGETSGFWRQEGDVAIRSVGIPVAETLAMARTRTLIFAGLAGVFLAFLFLIVAYLARFVTRPIITIAKSARRIAGGELDHQLDIERQDEIGELAGAFNQMTAQLRQTLAGLEQRVAERTRTLARRSVQLETAAQVSEAAGRVLEPEELEQRVVELIQERFDYYYVGLFLLDEAGKWAVLRAGTGEAGRQMLEAGHRLEVGSESMIGGCAANGTARIALDVGQEAVRFDNPYLPETRSEMALPLMARGEVIGALSVQSEQEAAFSEEDIFILQTMAAQVANAIQNARLYDQLQDSEKEYRTIINDVRDGYYQVDMAGNLTFFNPALSEILGYPPDELMGMNNRQFMKPETAEMVYQAFNEVYRTGKPARSVGWEFVRKDGTTRSVEASVSLVRGPGQEPVGFRGFLRDVTGRRQAELEREQLLNDLKRRAVQLQTSVEVSRAAGSILNVDELLVTSVNLIHRRFAFYYVGIFLVDEAAEFAVLRAGSGEAGRQMLEQGHKLAVGGSSMIGWCVANKQARIALDVGQDAVRFDNPFLPHTRSEMALPLIARGQALGAMTIQSVEEAAFSESDISVLQIMADQIANATENARLFETEQRRRKIAIVLQQASMALGGILDAEEIYQEALSQLAIVAPYDSAALFIYDEATRVARPVAAQGVPRDVLDEMLYGNTFSQPVDFDPLFKEIVEEGQPIVLRDAQEDERFLKAEGTEYIRGWMGVPLIRAGKVVGLLTLDSRQAGAFYEGLAFQTLTFAAQVGLALENARLYQETQANLQEVTRLHRRYLQEQWQEFLAEKEAQEIAGYLLDRREIRPAGDLLRPEIEMAVSQGRTLALSAQDQEWEGDGEAKAALVVPLQLRDQIIGALDFFETEQDRQWSEEDIALVEAVAAQVSLAVENARAYKEIQKTAARLREMDTLKTQFLANMSHELRTPLNSIIGFSRVMLKGIDGPLTELQETDLTSIYNNGQNLLGLINDILDMSRIEAGKMELVFEPMELPPIIDGVMSTAVGLVKDKSVKLVKELAGDLPVIHADSTRIRQVILNLVSNAAKFTAEGSITVRAWAEDNHVAISVIDTGIGISEEHWNTIFQEFQQVDGSATRRAGGSGLGLPISRHFVELHGGRIWVESVEGEGSIFTFTIPIHAPDAVNDPELAALKIDPDRRLVLAVEGSVEMVDFYRRYLTAHGYQVIGLAQGERALSWVCELAPFAVLLDVMLPDTDGWAVLESLKTSRETAHVPVIVCSIVDKEARGLSLGAAAYLTKPILEEDLLQAMNLASKLQPV